MILKCGNKKEAAQLMQTVESTIISMLNIDPVHHAEMAEFCLQGLAIYKKFHNQEDMVLMPKALTAENGAKGLLIGEFKESIIQSCPDCDNGVFNEDEVCESCDGAGDYSISVPVSWTTTKEIYAMAVKHLSIK